MEEFNVPLKLTSADKREVIRLRKELRKIYDSQTKSIYRMKQLFQIRYTIFANKEMILKSLICKNDNSLTVILKCVSYDRLFFEENFLKLLVSESITNRLTKACKAKSIPDWLSAKIGLCALAYWLFELNYSFEEEFQHD